jgi:type IV secretion system protein VirD4
LATQWTAWRLGFQSQLGRRWFEVAGGPVYVPVAFFWWWYHCDAYAPRIFLEGAGIAASGGFAAIGIAIGMSVWRAREAKAITTYGSARWATKREIRAAGFSVPMGSCLASSGRTISGTTGRSTCSASPPPGQERGSDSSSRHS